MNRLIQDASVRESQERLITKMENEVLEFVAPVAEESSVAVEESAPTLATVEEVVTVAPAPKARRVKKAAVVVEEPAPARRGRPRFYQGTLETRIVSLIRKHGLTGARNVIAEEGVQVKAGQKKVLMDISMPTLGKLAKANGVTLQRGRPSTK
jgi:hypothetical protein